MVLADISLFLGRFHPVILHMPIGILFVAVALVFLQRFIGGPVKRTAIGLVLLLAGCTALFAIVTGLLLATEGGYDQEQLNFHKWLGIATGVIIWICYGLHIAQGRGRVSPTVFKSSLLASLLAITVTGHWGGNLTHGETFLTEHAPFGLGGSDNPLDQRQAPASLAQTQIFPDVIYPIFKQKCQSCHSSSKSKGDLQLHTFEVTMEGGDSGPALVPGDVQASLLIQRINLPPEDKEAMPPKGKTPLTEEEKQLLAWWIAQGAENTATLETVALDSTERKLLMAHLDLENEGDGQLATGDDLKVPSLSSGQLESFSSGPFRVQALSQEQPDHLEVFVADPGQRDIASSLKELEPIGQNIIWLRLPETDLSDADLSTIASFSKLTKLWIQGNELSNEALLQLKALEQLRYLNVSYMSVDSATIEALEEGNDLQVFAFTP